jgi:hypothetical protein
MMKLGVVFNTTGHFTGHVTIERAQAGLALGGEITLPHAGRGDGGDGGPCVAEGLRPRLGVSVQAGGREGLRPPPCSRPVLLAT